MVRLVPMAAADFGPYLEQVIPSYAEDNVRAGRWSRENAVAEARKQVEQLLPTGLNTPDHFLFSICPDKGDEKLGVLWLAIEPRGAFVYDIEVYAPFRRRGYAEAALRLIEKLAREKGAVRLTLQVFGDNIGARKLYAKLGYLEVAIAMSKPLVG